MSQTKRKKAEPLPKVALFTSKPKPRKPERIENIDSPDPQEGLSKDQIERFGEEIEKYPIINPTKLGNPETKTELPLLAKVELGLIKGDKAIEALCKEIRVSEAERNKLQEEVRLAKIAFYATKQLILKLQGEIEQLKAVRDALGRSNKKALADRDTFIKRAEVLEGRIEKAVQGDFEFLWKEYGEEDDSKLSEDAKKLKQMLHAVVKSVGLTRLSELQKRLEEIRKHYEKLPSWGEARQKSTATNKVEEEQIPAHLILIDMWNAWARELGVLLSAKELDQKTRED